MDIGNEQQQPPSIYVKEGMDTGRIEDPMKAMEVAQTEANIGRTAALVVEEKMESEMQTGLTLEQKINVEVMEALENKYPDAFKDKIIDSKGRKSLVSRFLHTGGMRFYVVNQSGVAVTSCNNIGYHTFKESVDWGKLTDVMEQKNDTLFGNSAGYDEIATDESSKRLSFTERDLLNENAYISGRVRLDRVDLNKPDDREWLKLKMHELQIDGEEAKKHKTPEPLSAKEIINNL